MKKKVWLVALLTLGLLGGLSYMGNAMQPISYLAGEPGGGGGSSGGGGVGTV